MSLNNPTNEREMNQRNIRDLQHQLHEAYKRITALNNEINNLQIQLDKKDK
jgi:uncharacterized small protein (DUF1192 family)